MLKYTMRNCVYGFFSLKVLVLMELSFFDDLFSVYVIYKLSSKLTVKKNL